MDMHESLGSFIDHSGSTHMPDAAGQLLELLEADEVEALDSPGTALMAEDAADRLEARLERIKKRGGRMPPGTRLIEDAVTHLRANEGVEVTPWTYEDGEGVRWFVLTSEEDDEIIACYSSAPFVDAEM
ncbi:MAG: hypothetical protein KC933_20695 [Myxococcales bacterium]|nr:hypothetical protein [Myxococcales bacterium]MCB9648811.1 hypothetical protein [Deltaproteobacteria bacterium]